MDELNIPDLMSQIGINGALVTALVFALRYLLQKIDKSQSELLTDLRASRATFENELEAEREVHQLVNARQRDDFKSVTQSQATTFREEMRAERERHDRLIKLLLDKYGVVTE